MAVAYALIISFFVYRDMSFKEFYSVLVDSALGSTTILMLMGLSKVSSYIVTTSGLPQQILDLFHRITDSKIVILLLLNILFLIIGMLMEANAAIVMMTPLLLPLLSAYGIDPLTFGIMMSFNLCVGLVTPPVGMCLLMTNQTANANFVQTLKSALPLIGIGIVVLMLVTYVRL